MDWKRLVKHLILLATYEVFISINSIILQANIIGYVFLSWIIPIAFYIYKLKGYRHKILLYGLLFSFPGGIMVDLIGAYFKAWDWWNNPSVAVTGIRIFGCPIEIFFWGMAFWILCICVYEYLFDKNRSRKVKKNTKYFIAISYLLSILVVIFIGMEPDLRVPFYYTQLIIVFLVFDLIILLRNKELFRRLAIFAIIMFPFALLIEFTSLALNLWSFHSEYLFTFQIISQSVPFEEILFLLVVPISIIGFYEIFIDNEK